MNKHIEKLRVDLESYLAESDLLSLEGLADSVIKTLYLVNTYKALFERESESDE